MNTADQHLRLTTPDIRTGDTVLTHGMRVQLDTPPLVTDKVYSWTGTVTDPGTVPRAYRPGNRWTVQGNDLAMWAVERGAEWTSVQCQQGNHEQCRDGRCTCYCHTSR